MALVNIYPFMSIVIFLLSGTSNVSVLDINVASLNISIVSPVSASFIASWRSVYSLSLFTNLAIGNLSKYFTS